MRKSQILLGIVTAFALAGCASSGVSVASFESKALKGEAVQVGKLKGQKTPVVLDINEAGAVVSFPELKNNMGENFAPTACSVNFKFEGAHDNSAAGVKSALFSSAMKPANNNCALFLERRSAQYDKEDSLRFLIVESSSEGKKIIMSWDKLGRKPIFTSNLK